MSWLSYFQRNMKTLKYGRLKAVPEIYLGGRILVLPISLSSILCLLISWQWRMAHLPHNSVIKVIFLEFLVQCAPLKANIYSYRILYIFYVPTTMYVLFWGPVVLLTALLWTCAGFVGTTLLASIQLWTVIEGLDKIDLFVLLLWTVAGFGGTTLLASIKLWAAIEGLDEVGLFVSILCWTARLSYSSIIEECSSNILSISAEMSPSISATLCWLKRGCCNKIF